MEIAALGLRVDGVDNIGKASQNLDDLKKSAQGAEGSLDSLSSDATRATKSIKEVGDQSDRSSSKISALGGVAKAAGGVIVAAFSVSKIAQYADAWSDMQSRVGAATGSMDTAGESMKRLLQIANASYSPLAQTSEIYSRNVSTFRDLGRSASDAADFTESLNNMLVLTATRGERAASVQNALSKAMAVGKLQADGLETVLANGGEVAQALATKLGTTVSGLRDMASQGKITGDVIASSIVGSLDDVRARAEEMPATLGDAFVRVGNNVTAFVGQMDQAAGTTSALAAKIVDLADAALEVGTKAIKVLSDNIDTIANTIILATKLTAAYVVAVYTIPAAKLAASTATTAYTAVLKLFTAQVVTATGALGLLQRSLMVVAAFIAGWQIGTYLRNEFEIFEKAGIKLASGIHQMAIQLGGYFERMGESISFALTNPLDAFRNKLADLLQLLTGLGQGALRALGLDGFADAISSGIEGIRSKTGKEHKAMLEQMKADTQREADAVSDIYADMFANVGKSAGANLEAVGKGLDDVLDRLGGFGGSLAATTTITKEQAKALAGLLAQAEITTKSANAMADAYLAGADSVRALTLEQKVEEQLLKTGASSRSAVVKALKDQQDALDRLDITKQVSSMLLLNKDLQAQIGILQANTKSTVAGREAQRAYNIEKQLTAALAGKNADALSKETKELRNQLKAQEDLREELEALGKIDRLIDSTATAQERLNRQLAELSELRTWAETPEQIRAIDRAMREAQREASQWAQWTESSLERVDSAFADAWRNIGDGFKGFRDNLTNAFKQMLAELAHMAITRPIIMQIGAAIGIGGGAGQIASMTGGGGIGGIANLASSAYSALTGWGPAAYSGFQSGGISGALNGVGGYYGSMFSGGLGGFQAGVQGAYLAPGLAGPTTAGAGGMMGAGSMVGNVAASAPWLAGLGGAFMGYQNSGFKGAASGAAGGYLGAKGGAALGGAAGTAVLPGVGTAVGSAIGAIVGGILGAIGGSKLFGGKWQTKAAGLALDVNDGDLRGWDYEYKKKKGGLFSSNKKKTSYSEMDAERLGLFTDAFDATKDSVSDLYKKLGFDVSDSVLSGLNIGLQQINTMGLSEEKAQEAVAKWFADAAETITSHIDKTVGSDLGLDFAGLQEFVGNLVGVNEVLRYLDVGMFDASVAGGKLAETLSGLAGGLDALSANAATYYDNFFSAEEKTEDAIDAITRTFKDAEVTLTDSRESYRKMVESIDLTSEAGQVMFTKMMALAGTAAQYFSIIEAQAAAAAQAAAQAAANAVNASMAQAGSAYSTLERSIAAERKRITAEFNAAAQAQQAASQASSQAAASIARAQSSSLSASMDISKRLIDIFKQIDNAVKSALDRLMGADAAVVAMRREQSLSIVRRALASGSLADTDGLADAIAASSIIDSASYKTAVELQREQGRTANLISDLGELNGKQLSAEEKIYARLSAQLEHTRSISSSVSSGFSGISSSMQAKYDADMAALDEELEAAKLQMDALGGVDNSIMSVREAVDVMNASVVAAIHQQNKFMSGDTSKTDLGSSAATSSNAGLEATIKRMYQGTLGYEADAQGVKHWTDRIKSGESLSVLQNALTSAAASAAAPKIPAFASGGFHSGGLRIVGENGPELEATGSSRIFNASQTESILNGSRSGDSTSAAITRLENTIAQQADALRSIAKHTRQSAQNTEILDRWDFDGLPQERTA
ncbi:MAG: phage tail tape measure protein [Gammaproteobacteria bacterium]|nr:phage tail tape measure protein [Gammaproteobacteria bacterium]